MFINVIYAYRCTCIHFIHLGHVNVSSADKMLAWLTQRFHWPGIWAHVARPCATCPECQLTQPQGPKGGELPIVPVTFEKIGVDLAGPLTASSGRHRFILIVIDYATQYTEAMPLRTAPAAAVTQELATCLPVWDFSSRFSLLILTN